MSTTSITTRILRLIAELSPISQSDLKIRSGLSMSAVSQATNRLLSKGIIQERGLKRVSMGRPKTLLGLNPDFAYVVGIQLNAERNLIVLTDLAGNLVGEQEIRSGKLSPEQLSDALAKFLKSVSDRHVGAIGLALAGLVDPKTGDCIRSTVLDWTNVPIAGILHERFKIPVFIENDANAMALAALVFGQFGPVESAIMVIYGQGIGAGVVINRQLHRGRHGIAGEIGHATLYDGSGRILEEVASTQAILRHVIENESPDDPPQNLLELEQRPSALALNTLKDAGHHLGLSLANLSVAIDPDIIYLAVEPQMASRILLDQVSKSFQEHRLRLTPQLTPLHFLTESKMCVLGAAGFAVNRLIDLLSDEADH